ncbi:MAG: phosphocholine cytidylyltransferase family protein, partial [Chloroflexota bacterium]
MKVIILAAGYGNRMRPLTNTTHKTLLEIGGRTVIQWIIDPLLANDITDITIVTGYMADTLQAYLSETYSTLTIQYIHNERYAQTNNIYSMALALEQITIDSDIILIECDLIFDETLIERLLTSSHENVALVDRYQSGMDGTVVQVSDGIITNVIPPHLQDPDFNFNDKYKTVNIYRFSQEFCANIFKKLLVYYAKTFDSNIYYELILGILIYLQREVIHAEILDGERWTEIDDPNDLNVARFMFDKSSRKKMLD